jgi:hypothetical protein
MSDANGKLITVEEAYAYAVLAVNRLIKEKVLLPGPEAEGNSGKTSMRAHYHCLNKLPMYMHKCIAAYNGEAAIAEAKAAKGYE